jgi:hypothetical protein
MGQMHVVAMDGVGRSGMCRTLIDMHHYVHPSGLRHGRWISSTSNISHIAVSPIGVKLTNLKKKDQTKQAQESIKARLMDPHPPGNNWWHMKAFHNQVPVYRTEDVRSAMQKALKNYRDCFP